MKITFKLEPLQVNSLKLFKQWLSQSKDQSNLINGLDVLEIMTDLPVYKRGLISQANKGKNNCCLSISLDDLRLILTPVRCLNLLRNCGCFDMFNNWDSVTKPLDALVLFIYHCKYSIKDCIIRKLWAPYVNVLPTYYSDPVFTMSNVEMDQINLQSTDVIHVFERAKMRMYAMWNRLNHLLVPSSTCQVGTKPFEEFLWAWSTINSRCVYCPFQEFVLNKILQQNLDRLFEKKCIKIELDSYNSNKNLTVCLVPFFDFINHNPNAHSCLTVSKKPNVLNLILQYDVSKSEQIFIDYGAHNNLTLLTEYGFSLEWKHNPHEAIHPTLSNFLDLFINRLFLTNSACLKLQCDRKQCVRDQICSIIIQNLGISTPDMTDQQMDYHWPTINISKDGASYHLILLLFAVQSLNCADNEMENLFLLSEDFILSKIKPLIKSLITYMKDQSTSDVTRIRTLLNLKNLDISTAFLEKLFCFFEQRCHLLDYLLENDIYYMF